VRTALELIHGRQDRLVFWHYYFCYFLAGEEIAESSSPTRKIAVYFFDALAEVFV
jgi:hypothetical protein